MIEDCKYMDQSLLEKQELVINSYSQTLDLELAYKKVGVSEEQIKLLNEDPKFLQRLAYEDAIKKEELIKSLFAMANNAKSESVKLSAVIEISRVLYPERFIKNKALKDNENDNRPQVIMYLPGNGRNDNQT